MGKKYFGTDGIRGRVGEDPITAEFVLKLGWAAGRVFNREGRSHVLIGKDTRISGYMFESALEAGLSAAGVDIRLLGPMPTPAIAYLTRALHAAAGIVISASHNPHFDNGFKFFSAHGVKLADDVEHAIEDELDRPMKTVESADLGKAVRLPDAEGRYIEFCKSTIPSAMDFGGIKVVVDCAHGAAYHVGPCVFEEYGAEVISIGVDPDGLNINQDVGSTKPAALQAAVLANQADLGVALDGDGDRVIMVDHKGEVVDGDELLFVIAESRMRANAMQGGVVGTLMSNLGLEHALRDLGLGLCRAAVGDRYVMEMLRANDWVLGGESSGHIICLDRTTTGDGLVAAMQVLAAMLRSEKSLHELKSGMTKYPQKLVNVQVEKQFDLEHSDPVTSALREAEAQLSDRGRVLLRPSGTEPVIRVMVEGQDMEEVSRVAEELATIVSAAAAA